MRHHHHRQNNPRDHIPNDHLDKHHVAVLLVVSHRWHADDRQRARLSGHDRQPNSPPRNIFAPKKIIARIPLIFPEVNAEPDDANEVNENYDPIRSREKPLGAHS
jgi:hypothetical protein